MPDNTQDRRAQDRSRVAGGEEYEVRYFAEKHGIRIEQAEQHGNSREKLDEEATKLSGGSQ